MSLEEDESISSIIISLIPGVEERGLKDWETVKKKRRSAPLGTLLACCVWVDRKSVRQQRIRRLEVGHFEDDA